MKKAIVITLGVIIGVTGVLAICAHLADAAKLALYVPEDELKLSYEIDEKYNADQMAEIINEYKKDLFLDAENWFAEMKVMGDKLGYCPNVKEYKKNPDAYKGSITDVCTIVRVAVTGKKNSPDLATIMNVIGKDRTIGRLDKFLAAIGK